MELTGNNRPIIICAGIGNWYPVGAKRLERSLIFNGWPCDIKIWTDYPDGCQYAHEDFPYYFKIAAFEWAIANEYTHVLWCDSSFWAVKNPMPLFDLINDQGFYFFRTGYNLAQTVNDAALMATGIPRDEAEQAIEYASGCVGINFHNPDGIALYNTWKEYMDMGLSKGSRLENKIESQDPRFRHHRQDQSCLSLAAYKLNLKNDLMLDAVAYHGTNYSTDDLIFFIGGL
jgi:hypothetical protein